MAGKVELKQKSDIVEVNDTNLGLCQCMNCPTYEQCVKGEKLFCGIGESKKADMMEERGCLCPTCQVFEKYDLADGFFCMHGEAV